MNTEAIARNAFRTERLVYRTIEDNEECLDFIHSAQLDPASLVNLDSDMFKLPSRQKTKDWLKTLSSNKTLCGVLICQDPSKQHSNEAAEAESSGPEASSTAVPVPQQQSQQMALGPAAATTITAADATKPAMPKPIGLMSLRGGDIEGSHHRQAYLFVNIVKEYQGQGYATEALKWLLNWGFSMAGLHRIWLCVYGWNARAGKLYERLGFVKEGVLREDLWFNGAWHDCIYYGLLENEWRELRKKGEV